jgi:hypothetical protein
LYPVINVSSPVISSCRILSFLSSLLEGCGMCWHNSPSAHHQAGRKFCGTLTHVQIVFQNPLNWPKTIPNMSATSQIEWFFCFLWQMPSLDPHFNLFCSLTFNGWTFKLPGTLCGRNLIGPKSFKLQTFRKNYLFSVLCSL